MPTATAQQIQQQLKYVLTGSLVNGAAVLTDATQYAGIGIAPPDTVLVLLQILDPTGNLFYQNANWNAGTYGSPDLQPIAGISTYSFTMPTDISGAYLTGQYTINLQVQVVQSGVIITVQNTQYATICNCCNGVTLNVEPSVSYNTAQVSVTDTTQYGPYLTLSRVLTLYAPATNPQQTPQVGNNVTTLTWVPPVNTYPLTGVWQWTLVSTITYIDQVTQAQTTCEITANSSFDVVQSQLCVVLCQLEEWRNVYWQTAKLKDTTQLTINYGLAINEFVLAMQATTCGRPQTQIDGHVKKIYQITGIDPFCPCACNTAVGQPLVPTNAINGTNGTNGLSFRQGAGVPAGSLGVVGDSYLNSSTGNIYLKTGATTWTVTENINGVAGVSPVSILYNNFALAPTTNTSLQTLDQFNIPAYQFANVGDEIDVEAYFGVVTNQNNSAGQYVQISVGGVITPAVQIAPSIFKVHFLIKMVRQNSNTVQYVVSIKTYTLAFAECVVHQEYDLDGANVVLSFTATFSNAISVLAQCQSVTGGDLTSVYLSGKYMAYGVPANSALVVQGTYANDAAAAAASVGIGQTYINSGTGAYTQRQH